MLRVAFLGLFSFAALLAGAAAVADSVADKHLEAFLCRALPKKCLERFSESAGRGDVKAQYHLGVAYEKGKEVQDKRKAARWYKAAAKQGHSGAQYNLGGMYLKGQGVVQNKEEAYIWRLIAQASGYGTVSFYEYALSPSKGEYLKAVATRRFERIEKGRNSAEFSADQLVKGGEEFAIAKPPEETNIAAVVFENTWRSVVVVKDAEGQGSGVIIRPNLVATNCHVIEGGGVAVYKPENGQINESAPFSAKVVYRKEEHDFCILEVKGLWGIAATIRKYDTLKVGENVYALGAPRGLDLSLSNGLISQLRADDSTRFIQTDAAISPGSSGGGLFDTKGNFIGILTSKYTAEGTEGIGFAIPADLALEF